MLSVFEAQGVHPAVRRFPKRQGPYLGEMSPGKRVEIFAPDIVAGPWGEHGSITFSPDGLEAFWSSSEVRPDSGYSYGTIWHSREVNGRWIPPVRASFAKERGDDVPFFAPGGNRLYFMSRRPVPPAERGTGEKIWYVDREGDGWGEPVPLPPVVNNMRQHWQISVAANSNIYFHSRVGESTTNGLYRSRVVNGEYTTPEFLGSDGGSPNIAPDESYLLFTRFLEGDVHLFITCPTEDGGWTEPFDLAESSCPEARGMCPIVTPDEKYLFFIQRGPENNISWIEADFLKKVRQRIRMPAR